MYRSFSAVELAFQVRKKPAYSGIKELPPWEWASVTRRMREPNVGSLMIYGLGMGTKALKERKGAEGSPTLADLLPYILESSLNSRQPVVFVSRIPSTSASLTTESS